MEHGGYFPASDTHLGVQSKSHHSLSVPTKRELTDSLSPAPSHTWRRSDWAFLGVFQILLEYFISAPVTHTQGQNSDPPTKMPLLEQELSEHTSPHPQPGLLGNPCPLGNSGAIPWHILQALAAVRAWPRELGHAAMAPTYGLFIVLGTRRIRGIFNSACGNKSKLYCTILHVMF